VDIVRHAGVDLLHDPLHNKVYPVHTLTCAQCDAGDGALGSWATLHWAHGQAAARREQRSQLQSGSACSCAACSRRGY